MLLVLLLPLAVIYLVKSSKNVFILASFYRFFSFCHCYLLADSGERFVSGYLTGVVIDSHFHYLQFHLVFAVNLPM